MVSGLIGFDADRAYDDARAISFPRETGSEGEKRASEIVAQKFKALGLIVSEEEFPLMLSPWIILRIGLLTGFILLLVSRLLVNNYPTISSIIIFVLMSALLLTGPIWQIFAKKGIRDPFGEEKKSKNIIAQLPPPFNSPLNKGGYRGVYTLILTAHYDSKSQSLSMAGRILWIAAASLSLFLLFVGYLPGLNIFQDEIREAIFLFTMLSVLVLFLNRSSNLSPGGLDNAGSVGLLIELAGILIKNPPENLNIIFVSIGAEEEGLMGAYGFIKVHSNELDPEKTFILNFDGIGIKGKLRVFTREKGIPGSLNRLPSWPTFSGLMMDHIAFRASGFKAVSLGCVSVKDAFKIHTPKDQIDIISPEGISEAGTIALKAIDELKDG